MNKPLDSAALDKLEALARAATPGPWSATHWSCHAATTIMRSGTLDVVAETTGFGRDANECSADSAFIAAANPATVLALIAQARAAQPAQPKREMPPEMKAAIEEAHKTGATSALLPSGSVVFINYGHDYGDNDHLCCTACGGSGHIEDQKALVARAHHAAATTEAAKLPKWIDDHKGSDPFMDDVIAYIEGLLSNGAAATTGEDERDAARVAKAVQDAMMQQARVWLPEKWFRTMYNTAGSLSLQPIIDAAMSAPNALQKEGGHA